MVCLVICFSKGGSMIAQPDPALAAQPDPTVAQPDPTAMAAQPLILPRWLLNLILQ